MNMYFKEYQPESVKMKDGVILNTIVAVNACFTKGKMTYLNRLLKPQPVISLAIAVLHSIDIITSCLLIPSTVTQVLSLTEKEKLREHANADVQKKGTRSHNQAVCVYFSFMWTVFGLPVHWERCYYCLIHAVFVRNSTCTLVFNWSSSVSSSSSSLSSPFPYASVDAPRYICSDSALPTPSWLLRLLACTMAHARQRCQAQSEPPARATSLRCLGPCLGDFLSTPLPPLYVPLIASTPSLNHLPRVDLGYGFSAQTWPPSLRQFFPLND